jgi:hypothetical protein
MALRDHSDPELIAKSAAVVRAFTPEVYAYLLSLLPTPEAVQANHNNYTASYAAYLAGDPGKAQEFETHRIAVHQSLSILTGLAQAVTVKDPKVPDNLSLGPRPSKKTSASETLSKPTGFKVFFNRDGRLVAVVAKVKSAKGYQVWACDSDPNDETNWRLFASSSTCRTIELPGVDRHKSNWLRVRAMRGKGESSPWSNIINLTPI